MGAKTKKWRAKQHRRLLLERGGPVTNFTVNISGAAFLTAKRAQGHKRSPSGWTSRGKSNKHTKGGKRPEGGGITRKKKRGGESPFGHVWGGGGWGWVCAGEGCGHKQINSRGTGKGGKKQGKESSNQPKNTFPAVKWGDKNLNYEDRNKKRGKTRVELKKGPSEVRRG